MSIQELVEQGIPPLGIQERLGISRAQLFRVLKQLNLNGYKYVSEAYPYGMGDGSHALRVRLGTHLYYLRERLDNDRGKVAQLVGLNRQEQIAAEARPWNHNWTISQIDRLCDATDTTLGELVNGPKREV